MNEKIRLSHVVIDSIRKCFTEIFLEDDHLWLFGSRVDPQKKGGDIDLYIETHIGDFQNAADKKIAFICALKKKIGDQKIDVVLHLMTSDFTLPIYEIAKSEGVQLV